MAGYNYAQNIIGLKKGAGDIHELELEVAQLSASVLTIGEKVENITEYSTDEKVVGKWIDGSVIYEKTIDFETDQTVGDWTTLTTLENVQNIISAESLQNGNTIPYIEYWLDGTTLKAKSLRPSTSDYVRYLTLRYTKTSEE